MGSRAEGVSARNRGLPHAGSFGRASPGGEAAPAAEEAGKSPRSRLRKRRRNPRARPPGGPGLPRPQRPAPPYPPSAADPALTGRRQQAEEAEAEAEGAPPRRHEHRRFSPGRAEAGRSAGTPAPPGRRHAFAGGAAGGEGRSGAGRRRLRRRQRLWRPVVLPGEAALRGAAAGCRPGYSGAEQWAAELGPTMRPVAWPPVYLCHVLARHSVSRLAPRLEHPHAV